TVAVVIGDGRHARPTTRGNAGGRRDVDEPARAGIAEEAIAARDRADVEVGPAVVVVVEEDGPGRGRGVRTREAPRLRHVREGSVAVVVIERRVGAAGEEDVLAAIAVDVGDRAAGARADGALRAAEEMERRRAEVRVDVGDTGLDGCAREARASAG